MIGCGNHAVGVHGMSREEAADLLGDTVVCGQTPRVRSAKGSDGSRGEWYSAAVLCVRMSADNSGRIAAEVRENDLGKDVGPLVRLGTTHFLHHDVVVSPKVREAGGCRKKLTWCHPPSKYM